MNWGIFFSIFFFFILDTFFVDAQNVSEFLIQGQIKGTGQYFEVKNSDYLNITLESTEEITVDLLSIPQMISFHLSSSTKSHFATFTLYGLEPNKTYYKYQDSYKNGIFFVSNENGSYTWLQDLTQPHYIWIQEVKGTIFLPQDCERYGIWDESTLTCTLTQNLTESIEITQNGITLDCNNYQIEGVGTGIGILLIDIDGATIKNCKVKNFSEGIVLKSLIFPGSNNVLFKNTLENNQWGIFLHFTSNETLKENIIISNYCGIVIAISDDNIVSKNLISNNNVGILLSPSFNNTLTDNTIINNQEGIVLEAPAVGNKIYHNNFVNNLSQVIIEGEVEGPFIFDNDYPSGGNYWSDYQGEDTKSGKNQDKPDSDGIGDTPYCFFGGCDRYPFMRKNGWVLPNVLISEVYYDVGRDKGKEGDNEWIIIHNLEKDLVDISGWQICDNERCDQIPTVSIPANQFAIITPTSTTFTLWKIPKNMVKIVLGSKFGSRGLANDGDRVILKDIEGRIVDAMSYGNDNSIFNPPCIDVAEGKSLLRSPPVQDTDTCEDFIESDPTIGKNWSPIPIINFFPTNPAKGVKVKFDASSSTDPDGEIIKFEWQIASTTLFGTTTEFIFNENGQYEITLIVTDSDGATSSTSTIIKVEPFSFAVITDLHIGRHYQEEYEGQEYYLTQRLRNVVNWINDNKEEIKCGETEICSLKFLVMLGDITENTSLVGFCKAKEILDELEIPYVPVFGNHDVGTDKEYEEFSRWKGQDYFDEVFWSKNPPCQNASSTKNFELLLNELNLQRDELHKDYKNFSFSFGGINFIGLDFNSRERFMKFGEGVGSDAVLNEINKGWLEKKLEEFKEEPVILLAHHPIFQRIIDAFSPIEYFQLREILANQLILFNFGGHVHSFEEFHGKIAPANANITYDPVGSTTVLTTEALMVGSNGIGIEEERKESGVVGDKKGIVRIVKVFDKNNINPYNWETTEKEDEFLAFNPKINFGFSIRRQFYNLPCMELEASKFSKKPSYFVWNFGGEFEGECNSDFTECYVCYKQAGEYTIELFAKDKNSSFEEKISKRINIQEGIFPRTIKKSAELIRAGIEFISEKAQMSFDKIGQIMKDKVRILKRESPSIPVGEIIVHFENLTTDLGLTNLVVDTDIQKNKTILYMENWPKEIEGSKILFLPKK